MCDAFFIFTFRSRVSKLNALLYIHDVVSGTRISVIGQNA